MKDFNGTTKTKTGIAIQKIEWNSAANLYLGMVADPRWIRPDRPFITCSWTRNGKCVNRTRPELDLI
jgi:hypothetical protein